MGSEMCIRDRFEICPAKGEEIITKTIPSEVVEELSSQKAMEIAELITQYDSEHRDITTPTDIMVIGADTVVAYENQILGKPKDEEDARRMLSLLSGNTHSVYTGVTVVLIDKNGRAGKITFHEKTDVGMYPMSDKQIRDYIATGESADKAGSYAIQGKCAIHIREIKGDYNNVVGLPVARLYQELISLGIDIYLW